MICPYCHLPIENHKFIEVTILNNKHKLYTCSKMPNDSQIWCIPELHISINNPKFIKE